MPDNDHVSIHKRKLMRIRSNHNHFKFYPEFTKVMSKMEALFIQDLMNLCIELAPEKEVDGDTYYQCTQEFLETSGLRWTRDEQLYYLRKLQSPDCNFLRTIRMGIPPKRWIHIDIASIENTIDQIS